MQSPLEDITFFSSHFNQHTNYGSEFQRYSIQLWDWKVKSFIDLDLKFGILYIQQLYNIHGARGSVVG
jgi:hypothetical protein